MINKEQFVDLLTEHQAFDKRLDEISSVLKIDIFELDLIEYGSTLFHKTLTLLFDEIGVDYIEWWLYEKCGRPDFKVYDSENNEIPLETIDELWDLVIIYRI